MANELLYESKYKGRVIDQAVVDVSDLKTRVNKNEENIAYLDTHKANIKDIPQSFKALEPNASLIYKGSDTPADKYDIWVYQVDATQYILRVKNTSGEWIDVISGSGDINEDEIRDIILDEMRSYVTETKFDEEIESLEQKIDENTVALLKNLSLWQPYTEYKVGQYVIRITANSDRHLTSLYECVVDHTSTASFNNDSGKWNGVTFTAYRAHQDVYGNVIPETYATNKTTANAVKGISSGCGEVYLQDVSPLKHSVIIKAKSKNLLDINAMCNADLVDNGDGSYTFQTHREHDENSIPQDYYIGLSNVQQVDLPPGDYSVGMNVRENATPAVGGSLDVDLIATYIDGSTKRFSLYENSSVGGEPVPWSMKNIVTPKQISLGKQTVGLQLKITNAGSAMTSNSGYITFSEPRIEKSALTEFEEYTPYVDINGYTITTKNADNTLQNSYTFDSTGIAEASSFSPEMIIQADSGVLLNIEYNKDTNAALEEIKVSGGGIPLIINITQENILEQDDSSFEFKDVGVTAGDIFEAIDENREVYVLLDGNLVEILDIGSVKLPLLVIDKETSYVCFGASSQGADFLIAFRDGGVFGYYMSLTNSLERQIYKESILNEDGTLRNFDNDYDAYPTAMSTVRAIDNITPLIVNLYSEGENNWVVDRSLAEIDSAYCTGKNVRMRCRELHGWSGYNDYEIPLTDVEDNIIGFSGWINAEIYVRVEVYTMDDGSNQTVNVEYLDKFGEICESMENIEAIAKGRATGYVFDTKADMDTWLANSDNIDKLTLGDNLYIRTKDVPDYWWDGSAVQELETQKVDLTEYVTKTELNSVHSIALTTSNRVDDIQTTITYAIMPELNSKANKGQVYYATGETHILPPNTEARFGEITSLTLSVPSSFEEDFNSFFSFKSGATATSLIYSSTPIVWRGDDCDEDGEFIPEANTSYEVSVKYLGTDTEGNAIVVARVGAF